MISIASDHRILGGDVPGFDELVVKNEPMLFNCDLQHAYDLGGQMTRAIINRLPRDWYEVPLVVDSRVHMLMPGWYPCIPGWHHDDVPRTRADGQPNYHGNQNRSQHIMCLVNGDICPTAFATGSSWFDEPAHGRVLYEDWHPQVEEQIQKGVLKRTFAPSNQLVLFDDRTWHTGTPALKNGWRFFIRFSRYFNQFGQAIPRGNPRTNELRRQVNVYLDRVNAGW